RLKRETESSRSAVRVAVDAEEAEAVKSSATTRPPSSGKQKSASAAVPGIKVEQQKSGRPKILVLAAVLIVAAALIGGALYFRSRPATPLTEKTRLYWPTSTTRPEMQSLTAHWSRLWLCN